MEGALWSDSSDRAPRRVDSTVALQLTQTIGATVGYRRWRQEYLGCVSISSLKVLILVANYTTPVIAGAIRALKGRNNDYIKGQPCPCMARTARSPGKIEYSKDTC